MTICPVPDDDRCLSTHLPPANPDYKKLAWTPIRPMGHSIRVRDFTCPYQSISYELCDYGGESFIRRTRRHGDAFFVDEAARGRRAVTTAIWEQLRSGDAR
ncbi:hypothetical protein AB0K12_31850 [Nonomuraea sp. NPDC049419]|uniref:hypothetical protein n=1 Tax=Nonomuraea sp. NPDC049419 TaxID=3155772 RepID=UPI0034275F70